MNVTTTPSTDVTVVPPSLIEEINREHAACVNAANNALDHAITAIY